jgi:hypothetical protein
MRKFHKYNYDVQCVYTVYAFLQYLFPCVHNYEDLEENSEEV